LVLVTVKVLDSARSATFRVKTLVVSGLLSSSGPSTPTVTLRLG
jgi:hypothetical protein